MPMVEMTDSELLKFKAMGALFTGDAKTDAKTVEALKEMILTRNRWAWVRSVMFNTAKWLVVVGGAITAVKVGVLDAFSIGVHK